MECIVHYGVEKFRPLIEEKVNNIPGRDKINIYKLMRQIKAI